MFHHLVRAASLAALLGPAVLAAAAEGPPRLANDAQKGLQQLDEAAEGLSLAKAALSAIDAGEPVAEDPAEWAGAPAALVAAAEALHRSSGLLVPEPEDRPVSVRVLKSCATRPEALAELERRHRALSGTLQRTADLRVQLRDRLTAAQHTEEARRFLVKTGAKHAGEPALAAAFTWRWAELEGPAAAALTGYAADLRRWLDRLDRSAAEQRTRSAEASELIATFGRAKDCLLAGSWSGTKTQAGAIASLGLHLVSNAADTWSGSAVLDGASVAVKSVSLSGATVTVALADGAGSLSGTLSPDGRLLKGTVSTQDGPAPFQLRKQP